MAHGGQKKLTWSLSRSAPNPRMVPLSISWMDLGMAGRVAAGAADAECAEPRRVASHGRHRTARWVLGVPAALRPAPRRAALQRIVVILDEGRVRGCVWPRREERWFARLCV